jgi:hypothetical protein
MKIYLTRILILSFVCCLAFACAIDNENHNPKQEDYGTETIAKSGVDFGGGIIAVIRNNEATPMYDENIVKTELVNEGFFSTVESIELVYGFNAAEGNYEAFVNIVGKQTVDSVSVSVAYVADLIIQDDNIIIKNPEIAPNLFNKHTCTGNPCSSCEFTRSGFWNIKITGCKCNDSNQSNTCNHSINGGGVPVKAIKTLVDAASL